MALRVVVSVLMLMSAPETLVSPRTEVELWRTTLREIRVIEALPPDGVLAVAPTTYFPVHLTRAIAGTMPEPECGITATDWPALIGDLSWLNEKSMALPTALLDAQGIVFGTRPEHEDFIGLSRVILLADGERALFSVSISNWAGTITLAIHEGDDWRLFECAEWASY